MALLFLTCTVYGNLRLSISSIEYAGLTRTIYIGCMYGNFDMDFINYTAICGVYSILANPMSMLNSLGWVSKHQKDCIGSKRSSEWFLSLGSGGKTVIALTHV